MLKKVLPALLLLVVSSCSKDQFKAEIPSYLRIEAIDLETESYEGSDSQKITDAWVTMDGNFLGAFELPAIVPILADGEHEFKISSGIKAYGISAIRIIYPFFEACDLFVKDGATYQLAVSNKVKLYRDSTVVVKATTNYKENTEFLFIESFEDAGTVLDASEDSDTSLIKTNVDSLVFEGHGSGEIHLDSINDFFELISSEFISLNSLYNATVLEMDYRCDHSFRLGVAVKSNVTGVVQRFESMHISPSEDWNKIYVHMTKQINFGNSTDEFGVFISAVKPKLSETASFYFDNIKWLHEQ